MTSLLPMILLVGAALLLSLLQLCNSSGRCFESYKCGDDTYSYPFWGGSRPSYCRVPGFQPNCQNSYPTETQIEIRNSVGLRQTYIVLNISEANQIMTIVSSDIWNFNSECPSEFLNDTASYNTSFEKAPGTLNYTLFYGCPFDVSYNSGGSDCYYANNTRNSLYVTADSVGSNQNISECQGSILIPVRPSSVRGISFGIIYDGFDVTYAGSYHSDCVNCTNSGGTCGYKSKYFYCYPPEFIAGNTAKTRNLRRIIALGGFGGVFKGKLLDGRLVAVKVMRESKGDGEDFMNEVASISKTSHVNVVSLLGFCFDGSKRALIYEFMSNGSLEKFIHKNKPLETTSSLPWEKLYEIVVGVSRGLEYLHMGCNTRIVHFDIKPHNILLNEKFCPKISDFGLAKLSYTQESYLSMSDARGTAGYIAPEVFSRNFGVVSHKSDVYSFGMMVLEIVGGRKNLADRTSEIFFPHWIHTRIELKEDLGLHGITSETDAEITSRFEPIRQASDE
ncbi:hypothetical protein GIB67_033603 [Kingdonia uniflora]|uniref:non-specific serine/threonine protein kinase n=1 Tax=Kingdonia uniflora TaxID=39325 RepID=A0A7J7LAL2_9MAGN|nr:hypothetical protein GIB67_033603 [Kingdonia uniflora]